jgi:hypothetical protein
MFLLSVLQTCCSTFLSLALFQMRKKCCYLCSAICNMFFLVWLTLMSPIYYLKIFLLIMCLSAFPLFLVLCEHLAQVYNLIEFGIFKVITKLFFLLPFFFSILWSQIACVLSHLKLFQNLLMSFFLPFFFSPCISFRIF